MKVYYSNSVSNTGSVTDRNNISKDGFLRILLAQLQNQDPLNAKDNSEFVAQMAQFSALEQMQNLNESMNNLFLSQKVHEGQSMVGKTVKVDDGKGGIITGRVTSTAAEKGTVKVVVDGNKYDVDNIIEVGGQEDQTALFSMVYNMFISQKLQQGSQLIGKTVTVRLEDNSDITGRVSGVKIGSSGVNLVIEGNEYNIDGLLEVSEGGSVQDVI